MRTFEIVLCSEHIVLITFFPRQLQIVRKTKLAHTWRISCSPSPIFFLPSSLLSFFLKGLAAVETRATATLPARSLARALCLVCWTEDGRKEGRPPSWELAPAAFSAPDNAPAVD